jgi:hypothetical protein
LDNRAGPISGTRAGRAGVAVAVVVAAVEADDDN